MLGAGIALAATLFTPALAGATPTAPTDTVASVTAKLHQIAQQNEQLAEQTNLATADVAAKQTALAAAQKAALIATATYETARDQLKQLLTSQYEGSAFSHTGALLNSSSGQSYLDQVNNLNMLSVHRSDVLAVVTDAQANANKAQATANTLLAQANAKMAALNKQKSDLAARRREVPVAARHAERPAARGLHELRHARPG